MSVRGKILAALRRRRGHHSRYHNFFSKSVWNLDTLSCVWAKLLVTAFAPAGILEWAVDDTLCRKRGLTVYGTGMHHDPLISSRAKPLVSWGHDGVVLTLIVSNPFWASTKVWSLPLAFRLYRNRQGLTKGKKKTKRSRKAQKAPKAKKSQKRPRKKGRRLPGLNAWANDPALPWQTLVFDPFGLHATLQVKTRQALSYKAGKDRLLTIVLWFHREGHRPLQFPDRPWYRRKQEPSFADLLTTLRRASWSEKIRTLPWPSRLVEKYLAPIVPF